MSDYAIRNIREIDDAAPAWGLDGVLEARFARDDLGAQRVGMSHQRLLPNRRLPFGHRHREQEELYLVLSGGGRVRFEDGESRELRPWDAIRVAPAVARSFESGDEGLELLAFGAGEQGDVEMLDDFWEDAPPAT